MAGSSLPERVAQMYYTYGLFCSSHPLTAITLALSVVLLCCYPLLNVPLPGNIPTVIQLPLSNDGPKIDDIHHKNFDATMNEPLLLHFLFNETQKLPYIWAKDKPLLYIQQIILKTGVSPWNSNLKMWDAFRAPLQEVFRLLDTIRNHEEPDTKSTLATHCYQVDNVKRRDSRAPDPIMPEYSCLLLSPANLWQQNLQAFSLDTNIITTIYNHQNVRKAKVSEAEMAFGMQLRDSGLKRYPLQARPRVLQYAVTIFYQHPDQSFIRSLTAKLRALYPLHQDVTAAPRGLTLVYYPGVFNYHELVPLTITFVGLFLYVYFSVRKIEFIRSKLGLAASAALTMAGSLSMSMGICSYTGFTLSLQGKEVFPYLVIIVGLENVLVLTKSVTSTDSRLDVKIRLAQGLSKEGWSITKNLLFEITIFTLSFFTFVPFIQEFSIFMIVSLISDYFIQMAFFATILGIDVRRMEYYQEQNSRLHLKEYFNSTNALNWRHNSYNDDSSDTPPRMTKSKSHPRLNGLAQSPTDVVAKRNSSPRHSDARVPKRIRLVNFWARTRFFQRAFMLWMVVWITTIVYNSGVVEYFVARHETALEEPGPEKRESVMYQPSAESFVLSALLEAPEERSAAGDNETVLLKHSAHVRPWTRLSPYHWSSILSQYNASSSGRYVVLLPPTLLSCRVAPDKAVAARNPDEKAPAPLRWRALARALDPPDMPPDTEPLGPEGLAPPQWGQAAELPIYPTTPLEILLLAILCTISVVVIAYMMVVLYRCVCSRNYAEWRASWTEKEDYLKIIQKQPAMQLVMEAVPLVVTGHHHEVECLATDGDKVVSSCLQGSIKVWDSQHGDLITKIDRASFFKMQKELYDKVNSKKAIVAQAAEVCIPPDVTPKNNNNNNNEVGFKLRRDLTQHLGGLRYRAAGAGKPPPAAAAATKYQFAKTYRELYCSEREDLHRRATETYDLNQPALESDRSCDQIFVFDSSDTTSLRKGRLPSPCGIEEPSERGGGPDRRGGRARGLAESPIWCMDLCSELIVLGCADGRLEFWEATSGKLVCLWWHGAGAAHSRGVTHVRALDGGRRICAASLGGHLVLCRLDAYNAARDVRVAWRFSTAHRRTHKRTGSAGSLRSAHATQGDRARLSFSHKGDHSDGEDVQCVRLALSRPHQQPISEMHCEGGRILTGGQDHVLKVSSSSDLSQLFTLHGHCGPITSCFIDHATPTIAGSGSQDGLLCVWDLHTGACLYSTQAHDGAVTSLAYTASYVLSAGGDERLCIWDRFQGHMLNSLHIGLNYSSRMLPLTHTLLLCGDRGGLVVYELSGGDVVRRVLLGESDSGIFVRQILPLKDAIVCDYANQLRIVRFPLVSKLSDMKSE